MSEQQKEVRGSTLKSEAPLINTNTNEDYVLLGEEAHYVHTINAFVELCVMYGCDKVLGDLWKAIGDKR